MRLPELYSCPRRSHHTETTSNNLFPIFFRKRKFEYMTRGRAESQLVTFELNLRHMSQARLVRQRCPSNCGWMRASVVSPTFLYPLPKSRQFMLNSQHMLLMEEFQRTLQDLLSSLR